MRILLIEDSKRLQKSICLALRKSGYAVDAAGDGEEGLWHAQCNQYDAIILDLMLPKIDGLGVLQRLRAIGSETHVLILTARDGVDDRVLGLQMGADDYLVKPFAFEELLARLQALIRRSYRRKNPCITLGRVKIDTAQRSAYLGPSRLELTPREYSLLELLVLKSGEVVTRGEIERCLYDERVEPMSNVVDSAVCSLRRKIDQPNAASFIQTRRGMGYSFVLPD